MDYIFRRMKEGHVPWLFAGFWSGLAAPADVYSAKDYRIDLRPGSGMRSDWERIGRDFRVVMGRADGEPAQESRGSAQR